MTDKSGPNLDRILTLNPTQTQNYFGESARQNFFSRYKWLLGQREKREQSSRSELSHFVLDDDWTNAMDYPFAPRRPGLKSIREDAISTEFLREEFSVHLDDERSSLFQQPVTSKKVVNDEYSIISLDADLHVDKSSNIEISPRSKYIDGCVRENIFPRPSLLVRKKMTKELKLQHQGMGDKIAGLLAVSLPDLLFVHTINVSDNCLTDVGLTAILNAIINIPNLSVLNISENIIGIESAKSLAGYLAKADCPLRELYLNRCELTDKECEQFVNAMKKTENLRLLDLSNNKLGLDEALTAVNADFVTAGATLAELLRSQKCFIHTLKLSWNMLRLNGGVALAMSLALNTHLTYLDISYNSLSCEGGMALGEAIIENKTLETLILVNNAIDDKACFTICNGIRMNQTLTRVALDGNPIGRLGSIGLMLIPLSARKRLSLSSVNCNVTLKSEIELSQDQLTNTFSFALESPFERAMAVTVLDIVAGHQTLVLSKAYYRHARGIKLYELNLVTVRDP